MRELMKKSSLLIGVLALLLTLAPTFMIAQDKTGDPKKGAEILDKFVEASGGKAAYAKIDNRYQKGTLSMPAMNISLTTEAWMAKPNLVYFKAESPELGVIERGYDGTTFWEKSMMTGPRILEGDELAESKLEAQFDGLSHWRDLYKSAMFVGEDSVNGKLADKVVVTSNDGKDQTLFFDKDSHLLTKVNFVSESQMGDVPVNVFVGDYRDVDGLKISFNSKIDVMGQERVMTVDSLAQNVELPKGIFDIPQDILDLQKSQDSTRTGE